MLTKSAQDTVSLSQTLLSPLDLGAITLRNRVFLAPMCGISDAPFRRLAHECGAGLVISEMIASEALVREDCNMNRRMLVNGAGPNAIQLAGREARWMTEGARRAEQSGADLIDINMGCPSRRVTNGLSGAALMRDLDHALSLIDATIRAVSVPVTLKMRLGWDENNINAPELARRAEQAGICMITVHGRTRNQFYRDRADWHAIARVKDRISIPLIANGDLTSPCDVETMLRQSGADGIMIGRGSLGRPWLFGEILDHAAGKSGTRPDAATRGAAMLRHYQETISLYGRHMGTRHARKHLVAYVEQSGLDSGMIPLWRQRLCQQDDPSLVERDLTILMDEAGTGLTTKRPT